MSDTPSQSPLPPPEPLPQKHSKQSSYSLVELLSKNIITAISLTVTANRWRVVVVDQPSLKIISNALKMHAILEQNVMAVQLITRTRQPYHDLDAIYVLVPCADSVLRMIDDFTPDSYQQEDYQPKYAHAHLYFTGELPEELFSQLISSPAAPYIRNISELFVEYNPFESRVFLTTPSEQPFYSLYSPHAKKSTTKDLDAASDRLLSVIATLGIHPYIRYYSPKETQKDSGNGDSKSSVPRISEAMAHRLQLKLDSYYSHESSKNGNGSASPGPQKDHGPPSVVLVLDRSVDLYAPLVHELTYQAMVYDLVNLEDGNKYVYTTKTNDGQFNQVEAELSEKADPLWDKLRHEHVGSVARILAERLERLIEGSTGIKALNSG
ncbi:syntaxin binding protein 1 [Coemansia interrupta]|uniref:Syntaxin binding protein 1 n=1 Tax=Coemansia interrupta TaxID=1126814 RepID=A0A9W8H3W2_9FUNG|nr:syntaxin binding protein 1 [Coemansia interrupta]